MAKYKEEVRDRNKKLTFIKRAEDRVNFTIKKMDLLIDLSDTSKYEYDSLQVQKIVSTLEAKLRELKKEFNRRLESKERHKSPFQF
tara:strand:+ start:46 stop:303 length:258 start_codon:yes stop_codon:yes gene_type:complete